MHLLFTLTLSLYNTCAVSFFTTYGIDCFCVSITDCSFLCSFLQNTNIPIQFLHYKSYGRDKLAVPVLTDTKTYREQIEKTKSNPNNTLAKISKQAEEHYKKHKGDENASFIKK